MAGRGFINDVPVIRNKRIQVLHNGIWCMMTEPINYDSPTAGFGFSSSFAVMWRRENKDEKIGLIPCAQRGSSLDEWVIDKTLSKHAFCEATFAVQN